MAKAPGRTYRYTEPGLVQWPFGHGLSYSRQTFSLKLATKAGATEVSVSVHNEGREADAVVLVYLRPKPGAAPPVIPSAEPASKLKRWLVHFERVDGVAHDAEAVVSFALTPQHATLVRGDGASHLYAGCYELSVEGGAATVDVRCDAKQCGAPCS